MDLCGIVGKLSFILQVQGPDLCTFTVYMLYFFLSFFPKQEGKKVDIPFLIQVFEDMKGRDIEMLVKNVLQKTTKLGAVTFNIKLINEQVCYQFA